MDSRLKATRLAARGDASLLCKEAFAGLTRRYRPVTRKAYDTLSRELGVIEKLDLADYFLICWDIVRWARERGMPCLGRGSAANSIVSYCLSITHVDPLRHNLFFERFLNEERTTPPDFDIDFGTDDREEVLDYVFERHGRDRVAMICTLNQMHARSAVRETAKALGVPTAEFDGFVKRLPAFADPDEIEEVLRASPVTRDLPVDEGSSARCPPSRSGSAASRATWPLTPAGSSSRPLRSPTSCRSRWGTRGSRSRSGRCIRSRTRA
jgi:DNA polymerase III alpha subunit